MKRSPLRFVFFLSTPILIAAVMVLGGCSSDDSQDVATPPDDQNASPQSATKTSAESSPVTSDSFYEAVEPNRDQKLKEPQLRVDPQEVDAPLWLPKTPYPGFFLAFDFSPDGQLLAGGSDISKVMTTQNGVEVVKELLGGDVSIWNPKTGDRIKELERHRESVLWIQFSNDGNTLVVCSPKDGLVRCWDTKTWTLRFELETERALFPQSPSHVAIAISHSGSLLATVEDMEMEVPGYDRPRHVGGRLSLWNVNQKRKLLDVPETFAAKIEFSPDESLLAVYVMRVVIPTEDGEKPFRSSKLSVHRVSDLETVAEVERGERFIFDIHWHDDQTIELTDETGWERLAVPSFASLRKMTWARERQEFLGVQYSNDGARMVRYGPDFVEVIDVGSGKVVTVKDVELRTPSAFSPNLEIMALESLEGPSVKSIELLNQKTQ